MYWSSLLLLLFLLIPTAYSGDIPTLYAPVKYQDAVSHAQEAFLTQSGIQGQINYAKDAVNKIGIYVAKQAGVEKPLGTALWCARVYKERTVSFPISHRTRVTLRQDGVEFKIAF